MSSGLPAPAHASYVELWTDVTPDSSRRLLLAAVAAFAEKGFVGATTRDIATGAGVSPAALYVHYRSKVDLLDQITTTGHEAILRECEEAMRRATGPKDRLYAFVEAFVRWHARFSVAARVAQYEIAFLSPGCEAVIRALRRRFREIVQRELTEGRGAGEFIVADARGTARAILSLGIDVARWYVDGHGVSAEDLGTQYADLVLRMVRPWSVEATTAGAT